MFHISEAMRGVYFLLE